MTNKHQQKFKTDVAFNASIVLLQKFWERHC